MIQVVVKSNSLMTMPGSVSDVLSLEVLALFVITKKSLPGTVIIPRAWGTGRHTPAPQFPSQNGAEGL